MNDQIKLKLQTALRNLIVSNFNPNIDTRDELLQIYEYLLTNQETVIDLSQYGHRYQGHSLQRTELNQMEDCVKDNNRIFAIKKMREVTKLGLKDAKDLIDIIFPQYSIECFLLRFLDRNECNSYCS
jgi:ribosomal protein L7/L12